MTDDGEWPQAGRKRMILPAPFGRIGTGAPDPEPDLLARMDDNHVFMMGDDPALPRMPEKPTLVDYSPSSYMGRTMVWINDFL